MPARGRRCRLTALTVATFVLAAVIWVPASVSAETVRFYMQPVAYRTRVCTGDTVTYSMGVYTEWKFGTKTSIETSPGVKVEGYPNDESLGTFDKRFITTGRGYGGTNTADFRFKAGKKPGKTTLVFQGTVSAGSAGLGADQSYGYVSFNIDIQIIECQFKVSGTVRFPPDPNMGIVPAPALVAQLTPVTLTVDADGRLTGSTIVHWVAAKVTRKIPGGECTVSQKYGVDDTVNINGELSDEGILTLHFEFPTAAGNVTIGCNGFDVPSVGFPYLIDLVTVYARTNGGSQQLATQYKDTKARGIAAIVVKKLVKS